MSSRWARSAIAWLTEMLPEPRDEAFISLARATRDLATGRRPVLAPESERRAVDLGWLLVDAYERLGNEGAREVFGHDLDAWFDYARSTVHNLEQWAAGPIGLSVYENDNNRLRFRRTLDFVQPGDRVFDVGFGRGYLCGLLLRDGRVAAYHGIDVVPEYIEATNRMLAANDLMNREVHLEMGNLFELRQSTVAESGATLVICCEVLEHVADPEAALAALSAALPIGTDLLFSVPLHGRLESVWGHVTVFDVSRLQDMIDAARLFVHHVEPVANTWTMVVASRDREASRRVQQSRRRPSASTSRALLQHYDFESVGSSAITVAQRATGTRCSVTRDKNLAKCQITAANGVANGKHVGGVSFAVRGFVAGRIELGFLEFDKVVRVRVEAYAGDQRIGQWVWRPVPAHLAGRASRRFAFRIGESSPPFKAEGFEKRDGIDRIEVLTEVAPGESAAFSIRAAYLPRR
jgi:2-polyprenyl-3-methyl-5-hydroxy-6-metoxy-1,4-benzoquinol methylase